MRFVILSYPDVTTPNIASLRRAAAVRGFALEEWQPHEITIWCDGAAATPLYQGEAIVPDVILHRTVARLAGIVAPALQLWRDRGVTILNDPFCAVIARDKLATVLALGAAGVPFVSTLGFFPFDGVDLRRCGTGPVILKPAHGLQGHSVSFFDSADQAEKSVIGRLVVNDMNFVSEHLVGQPVVGFVGKDIRAYVVGGRCLGIMARSSVSPAEWRANLALGGKAIPLPITHPAGDLAVQATSAVRLDYAGVDILEDGSGNFVVLEVDAWAGFAGLEESVGVDVAGAILELAISRAGCPG